MSLLSAGGALFSKHYFNNEKKYQQAAAKGHVSTSATLCRNPRRVHGNKQLTIRLRIPQAQGCQQQRTERRRNTMNTNICLCVDLKTVLRTDLLPQPKKAYRGVLILEPDGQFFFHEAAQTPPPKRNPHLFEGRYITITLKDDGTYRTNFCPIKNDLTTMQGVQTYADAVHNELLTALKSLVEKNSAQAKNTQSR